jgi:regulatory protein
MREEPTRPFEPGTITRLVAQKKNPDRVSVFVDGAFAFGIYKDLVLEFGLKKGREISVEEAETILKADALLIARSRALKYLAHKPRTRDEVRKKLRDSGLEAESIERVLDRIAAMGLLDDAAYAHDYVKSRINSRGYGPERIRRELIRRGVDSDLVEEALREELEGYDLLEVARSQANRRWEVLKREPDPLKRRRRLAGYLQRRGFDYDVVRSVVEALERGG